MFVEDAPSVAPDDGVPPRGYVFPCGRDLDFMRHLIEKGDLWEREKKLSESGMPLPPGCDYFYDKSGNRFMHTTNHTVLYTKYKYYETDEAPKQKLPPGFEYKSKIVNGKRIYFINSNGNFLTITKADNEAEDEDDDDADEQLRTQDNAAGDATDEDATDEDEAGTGTKNVEFQISL